MNLTVNGWVENEKGPDCPCGGPTVVKITPSGKPLLICLFHTREAGAFTELPLIKPSDWNKNDSSSQEP